MADETVPADAPVGLPVVIVDIGIGAVKTAGLPIKMSVTPGQIRDQAPSFARDTEAVLLDVGFSPAQIVQMEADGGIVLAPTPPQRKRT